MKKGHFLLSIVFAALVSAAVRVGVVNYTSDKIKNPVYESFSDLENNSNAQFASFNSFNAAVPQGLDLTKAAKAEATREVELLHAAIKDVVPKLDKSLSNFLTGFVFVNGPLRLSVNPAIFLFC